MRANASLAFARNMPQFFLEIERTAAISFFVAGSRLNTLQHLNIIGSIVEKRLILLQELSKNLFLSSDKTSR